MDVGIAKRALDDDPHCGDECGVWESDRKIILCIADGLGHGEFAERAARAAVDYVMNHPSEPIGDIFSGCDSVLRGTRGAAMGVAVIDEGGRISFAGVGNTRAVLIGNPKYNFSSNYGIVGGGYRKLFLDTKVMCPGDLLIMTTDGIEEIIDLSGYDSTLMEDPQDLAERILHDCSDGADDAAVLVYKGRP